MIEGTEGTEFTTEERRERRTNEEDRQVTVRARREPDPSVKNHPGLSVPSPLSPFLRCGPRCLRDLRAGSFFSGLLERVRLLYPP
jgi:hypothetical protein